MELTITEFSSIPKECPALKVFQQIGATIGYTGWWWAGHSVMEILAGEDSTVSDLDLYVDSPSAMLALLTRETIPYTILRQTPNAIKIKIPTLKYPLDLYSINTLHSDALYMKGLISSIFDFTACQAGISPRGMILNEQGLIHQKDKELHCARKHLRYPAASLRRSYKYVKKGFFVPAETLTILSENIASLIAQGGELNFEDLSYESMMV